MAALVKGFCGFEGTAVAGVIANYCGSAEHGRLLEAALRSASLPGLVGAVPRDAIPKLSSRHLGLVSADPARLSGQVLKAMAEAAGKYISLEHVVDLARQARPLETTYSEALPRPERVRLGIAWDEAFQFYYQDFLDALEEAGCGLVRFSPIADRWIPEDLDGLYFGGGYPEEHAATLAANKTMLDSVRQFTLCGGLIYAECGGLLYLCRNIETLDGSKHAMAGIMPAEAAMHERRQSLAYVEVSLKEDSLWGLHGQTVRGHEFHYSSLTEDPCGKDGWQSVYTMKKRRTGSPAEEGFQRGRVLASYAHLHLASRPGNLQRFISQCEVGKGCGTKNPERPPLGGR